MKSGSVYGSLNVDNFQFMGMNNEWSTQDSPFIFTKTPFTRDSKPWGDGWIGLGPYSRTTGVSERSFNILQLLKERNLIKYPIASFYLNKGDESESHIALGSWDPSLIKKGHLFMLRCKNNNHWEVRSTSIKVGGVDILHS